LEHSPEKVDRLIQGVDRRTRIDVGPQGIHDFLTGRDHSRSRNQEAQQRQHLASYLPTRDDSLSDLNPNPTQIVDARLWCQTPRKAAAKLPLVGAAATL